MKRNVLLIVVSIAVVAALCIIPLAMSRYVVRFLTTFFMFAALALAWNIIGGFTGYISFGHIVFFGVGAYGTTILMMKVHFPFFLSLLSGGVIAFVYGFVLGFPLLRLKGHYFAVATLGIAEATREIVSNLPSLTGGGSGMNLSLIPGSIDYIYRFFYYGILSLALVTLFISFLIKRSRFGYGLFAIRDDEEAANIMGINTTISKTLAFSISAFFFGILGGIYAYWMSYIRPEAVFQMSMGIMAIIMVLVGGTGTLLGPIIGAVIIEFLSEVVWSHFLTYHHAILGVLMILVLLFMPKGFIDLIGRGRKVFTLSDFKSNIRKYRV